MFVVIGRPIRTLMAIRGVVITKTTSRISTMLTNGAMPTLRRLARLLLLLGLFVTMCVLWFVG